MIGSDLIVSDHHVNTPNGKLFAREWSSAANTTRDAIVLIHDSLGCVELWRDFPELLSRKSRRNVIAYDRLGFGRSDARDDVLQASFVREEVEIYFPCVQRHFRLDRFITFGHSVGGSMAISCGAAFPDSCAAVVTESAQMFAEEKTLRAIAAARVEYADPSRLTRLRKYHREKTEWVLAAWIDTWLSGPFAGWNVREELRQLRCPLLALHGERDEFGSTVHLDVARDLSGGTVTTVLLHGQGHVPHRETSEAIVDRVAEFLDRAIAGE